MLNVLIQQLISGGFKQEAARIAANAPDLLLYAQKSGEPWLVGGASKTGGGVLVHFFSVAAIKRLSQEFDPTKPSDLNYYPLVKASERFPINDPPLKAD